MKHRKTILIFTTTEDRSAPLFTTRNIAKDFDVTVCLYKEGLSKIASVVKYKPDILYMRDPFTEKPAVKDLNKKLLFILSKTRHVHIIDNLHRLDNIYFEDKWLQYKVYKQFMPKTSLLRTSRPDFEKYLVKKRISSRAKGIVLSGTIPKSQQKDYILQQRIPIAREYRVYVLFGKIIPVATEKSPKIETGKVKVLRTVKISPAVKNFAKRVIKDLQFDLVGLDIIETSQKKLYLLEVNRSPQWAALHRLAGINLAEELFRQKITMK